MMTFTGRVWKFGDDINTDIMYPGFALQLPVEEAAQHMFYEHRPGWVEQVQPGDILVGGTNFGIGSSRPVPLLARHLGIVCILAEEFNSLFIRNCVNYGLPALEIRGVSTLFDEGDTATVHVEEARVRNDSTESELRGDAWPDFVLDIIRGGGLVERLRGEGYVA
jgi:3-isopropylmalate/(R)-2-methylmalate dehydratase small subunit